MSQRCEQCDRAFQPSPALIQICPDCGPCLCRDCFLACHKPVPIPEAIAVLGKAAFAGMLMEVAQIQELFREDQRHGGFRTADELVEQLGGGSVAEAFRALVESEP